MEATELVKMKGYPGVFETDASFQEEKFRFHALRNSTYVAPLPIGFQVNWHSQYSMFTATDIYSKRLASVVVRSIESIKKRASQAENSVHEDSVVDLSTFLLQNVKRFDNSTAGKWMSDLTSGTKNLQELIQSLGVPFKQWKSTSDIPQCPLLEFILEFRPGYLEASWYAQVNVFYTEVNETKRVSMKRIGDNLFHPKLLDERSTAWTKQLIAYMHGLEAKDQIAVSVENKRQKTWTKADTRMSTNYSALCSIRNHRNGSSGFDSRSSDDSNCAPNVSIQEKWSYLLKLSNYQYRLGLLNTNEYLNGLLSLLQKSLSSPSKSHTPLSTKISIAHNQVMELVAMIHRLVPDIMRLLDTTISLVKILVHHIRCLILSVDASCHNQACTRELACALCQLLRDILIERENILVCVDESGMKLTSVKAGSLYLRH